MMLLSLLMAQLFVNAAGTAAVVTILLTQLCIMLMLLLLRLLGDYFKFDTVRVVMVLLILNLQQLLF